MPDGWVHTQSEDDPVSGGLNSTVQLDNVLSPEELSTIVACNADWLWQTDSDFRYCWFSEGFEAGSGFSAAAMVGRSHLHEFEQIAHADPAARRHLADIEARRPFRNFVFAVMGGRPDCRWVSISGVPRFSPTGAFLGYFGSATNVTATAVQLDALRGGPPAATGSEPNSERMLTALNLMNDAVAYYDREDRLVLFNEALVAMYSGLEDVLQPGLPFATLLDVGLRRGLWQTDGLSAGAWRDGILEARRSRQSWQSMLSFTDGRHVMHREQRTTDGGTVGVCTDITALKIGEARLARTDAQLGLLRSDLERIVDAMDMGVLLLDADMRVELINRAFRRMWGMSPDEAQAGTHFSDIVALSRDKGIYDVADGEWDDYAGQRVAEVRAGSIEPSELRCGDGRTLIHAVTPLSGDKRLVTYYDVTELKQRETDLRESMRKIGLYQHILDELPVAAYSKSADLEIEFVNKAWCDITGLTPAEVVGKTDAEIFGPEAEGYMAVDREVARTGRVLEAEEVVVHRDGRQVHAMTRKSRLVEPDGSIHLVGSTTDITEVRNREAELRESMRENEVFRSLVDNVPVAIYAKSGDLRMHYVNRGWSEVAGVPREAAIGNTDIDIFGPELGAVFMAADREALRTGVPNETYETMTAADGTVRHQVARKTVITASDGTRYVIGSTTDITELKVRERQLEEAQRRAEIADRAKSEFLANMSHEIRTPMNGILGMAELLAKSELTPKQKTFTDIIVKSGNALLTIINDILDFSKIDAGQLVLDPAPFHLAEAIEDVATLVSTRAKEKDLELIVRVDPSLDTHFVGDVGRIRQIVTNLLGNAVKFTEMGHVLVNVAGETVDGKAHLRFSVADTGIGIPADKLGLVFEKFSQVDASSTRRHEGTGLGLAITARLVELMGGQIGVESVEGEGSTFWFTVTLPVAAGVGKPRGGTLDVGGARILVVDDNAVNRAILTEQMAAWGFDSCAAQDAEEGLKVLSTCAALGLAVDCVVLDYQMPGMSGTEMARAMCDLPGVVGTPIVMLTSVDTALTGATCRSINIGAQLIKPARSSVLLDAVMEAIHTRRNRLPQPPGVDAPASAEDVKAPDEPLFVQPKGVRPVDSVHRLDILVAEDNEVNQLVFTQILGENDCSFEIVANGRLAVDAYHEMNPRMILMDVSMPEMNGFEATAAIRKAERGTGTHVPIIGVTAHALKGDRERCLEAGMDDYLPKPISPKALIEKIRRWTRQDGDIRDVG